MRIKILNNLYELLSNQTLAESRVYNNRLHKINTNNMPAILIYTTNEEATRDGVGFKQRRELYTSLEIYATSSEANNIDDILNNIASQVEQILSANHTLINNNVIDVKYTGCDISLNGDGEQPIGILKMNYTITYRVLETNPNNPIN